MADSNIVLVEILQGQMLSTGPCCSCSGGCPSEESCEPNTDYANLTTEMTDEFANIYGDKVSVKYVNVEKEDMDKYPVLSQLLLMGYTYPFTLIDGQPKFAGGFEVKEIKEVIEETLKSK